MGFLFLCYNFCMKKLTYKKGFTLIELLVVVAIIGMISAIVIAGVSDYRNKAKNATIKEQLASMRSEAELLGVNGHFSGVCVDQTSGPDSFKIYKATLKIISGDDGSDGKCNADSGAWAATISLPYAESGNSAWCVDSTMKGKAINNVGVLGSNTVCP